MIKLMLTTQGTTGLIMQCDVCDKLIRREGDANVCWCGGDGSKKPAGHFFEYRLACSDECLHALDKRYGHQDTQELGPALVHLITNTRVDIKRAQSNVAAMRRNGLAS
jgi:hypothetical protein